MTPNERAVYARQMIENPIFDESLKAIETRLWDSWKTSSPDAWKARERMYDQLQALIDIKQQLETYVHTAAMETTAKVQHGSSSSYNF